MATPDNMPDQARALIKAIEDAIARPDRSLHLRALADVYEENGDPNTAAGYRWLADNNRRPAPLQAGWRFCKEAGYNATYPGNLPYAARDYILRVQEGPTAQSSHGLGANHTLRSYYRAAVGLGQWLASQQQEKQ